MYSQVGTAITVADSGNYVATAVLTGTSGLLPLLTCRLSDVTSTLALDTESDESGTSVDQLALLGAGSVSAGDQIAVECFSPLPTVLGYSLQLVATQVSSLNGS